MIRLVIDASVLVKLFFAEDHSEAAVRCVRDATELLAPDLLWVEAANVVWKRLRRNEITAQDAETLVHAMQRVPITTHSSFGLISPALTIAADTGRTVYDCLYLALAIQEGIPMLTGDERLANSLRDGPFAKSVHFIGDPP